MAYTPTTWANDVSPDINATNLNKIETGIVDAHAALVINTKPGDIKMVGYPVVTGSSEPTGWLNCDGRAVSRVTYSALWDAVGTAHGAGDGSTTFNLPDFAGRTPIGVGTGSGLTARALGAKVGVETVALSIAEMPVHNHGGATGGGTSGTTSPPSASTGTESADHTHAYSVLGNQAFDNTHSGGGSVITGLTAGGNQGYSASTGGRSAAHTHAYDGQPHSHSVPALSISNQGSGTAHTNMQPSYAVNFLIKT